MMHNGQTERDIDHPQTSWLNPSRYGDAAALAAHPQLPAGGAHHIEWALWLPERHVGDFDFGAWWFSTDDGLRNSLRLGLDVGEECCLLSDQLGIKL